ncbi:sensor histidine kinase [Actinokineospora auranticolor]|nr:sensor histidine kinase [Actinokineospora auranticolor]
MELLRSARLWVAGAVAAAYLFDLAQFTLGQVNAVTAFVPVPLLMCVVLALYQPVWGAMVGAAWVIAGSAAMHALGAVPSGRFTIDHLTMPEVVGGASLVVMVVWRCRGWVASGLVALLGAAGIGALGIRQQTELANFRTLYPSYSGGQQLLISGSMGLLVLLCAVVAGFALRAHEGRGMPPAIRQLVRRQWPMAGALLLLTVFDLVNTVSDYYGTGVVSLLPLALMLATAVCAVLGPMNPLKWAVVAAALVGFGLAAHVSLGLADGDSPPLPVPTTVVAAHMALVCYLVRYVDRERAVWGAGALVGIDVFTLSMTRTGGMREALLVAAFLLVVAAATGEYFRARDRERTRTVQVAVTGAQQAERMALARELHDVVAHHVTGIVVAAQAARLVGETNPQAAVSALDRIEGAGIEALAAMRMLVGSMRGAPVAGAEGQATMDLAFDLRALAENFPGPVVVMDVELPPSLPPEAGRSVLRIVQEALTNIGKHAHDAKSVEVTIRTDGDDLHLRVVDDATTQNPQPACGTGGYGLVGMRERIDLLGGRFEAGPGEQAGWVVDARFPLRREDL